MNIIESTDQQLADLIATGRDIEYPAFEKLDRYDKIEPEFASTIDKLLPHNAFISLFYHGIDQAFVNPLLDDDAQHAWYFDGDHKLIYFVKLNAYNKHDFPTNMPFMTDKIQHAIKTDKPVFELGYTFNVDINRVTPLDCRTVYNAGSDDDPCLIPLPLHPDMNQYPSLQPEVIANAINHFKGSFETEFEALKANSEHFMKQVHDDIERMLH